MTKTLPSPVLYKKEPTFSGKNISKILFWKTTSFLKPKCLFHQYLFGKSLGKFFCTQSQNFFNGSDKKKDTMILYQARNKIAKVLAQKSVTSILISAVPSRMEQFQSHLLMALLKLLLFFEQNYSIQ